jgi:uncharacterized protein YjiS (DUF1127 family)
MSLSCQDSRRRRVSARARAHLAGALSRAAGRIAAALAAGAAYANETLLLWRERGRQRRALQNLNDDQLKDIGLSRCDVEGESVKWFWRE